VDGLDADADTPRAFTRFQFGFGRSLAEFVAFKVKSLPQRGGHLEKYRLHVFPKNVLTARREISPPPTNHHGSRIAREEKQTIFETSHYGIQIFAHRAENLVHTAQLLSNLRDFLADKPQLIRAAGESVACATGASNCPRKCDPVVVLISCNGASVAPLTTIASPVETSSATSAIAAEFRRLGRISFRSSEIEMPTRTSPKGSLAIVKGYRTS